MSFVDSEKQSTYLVALLATATGVATESATSTTVAAGALTGHVTSLAARVAGLVLSRLGALPRQMSSVAAVVASLRFCKKMNVKTPRPVLHLLGYPWLGTRGPGERCHRLDRKVSSGHQFLKAWRASGDEKLP